MQEPSICSRSMGTVSCSSLDQLVPEVAANDDYTPTGTCLFESCIVPRRKDGILLITMDCAPQLSGVVHGLQYPIERAL